MKTAKRITSILAAGALAGAGLVLGSSTAMAAPAGGFPADWQPFSASALQQLADLGVQPVYTGSRTFTLEKTSSADVVISGWAFATEQGTFPALRSGTAIDIMYPGAMSTHDQSPSINSVAHASYYAGGTNASGNTAMTWLIDYTLSAVPSAQLAAAGLKPHNPSTYSDCVTNVCGIEIAPAQFVTANPGNWADFDHMLTTADSVFIPVNYVPQNANGVESTDWDAHNVTWSAEPGKVTGVYDGVLHGLDGVDYQATYTTATSGGIDASAPWFASAPWGSDTWSSCGDVIDPGRVCIGLGLSGSLLNSAISALSTSVDSEIGTEIITAPPVSAPPISTPPVVSTPETPAVVEGPAIPVSVESGAYKESMPAAYWVALMGFLAAVAAVAAVGGLIARRRLGDAA